MNKLDKRSKFLQNQFSNQGYTFTETLADGITGEPVIIPSTSSDKNTTIVVVAGAGSGKVQFTIDPDEAVTAGTALWIDWDKGAVTGTETDVAIGPITALRGVSVSGEISWKVCV